MKEAISKEDKQFVDEFLADELTEKGLQQLDEKLKNPDFKSYYEERLNAKYNTSSKKLFASYLPMILLILLTISGIILILRNTQ